ncbi:HEAT repeat domain-containing protein [Pseudodesulfovibrio portus]|uniref:HEAT repeat domain-containing protein n=1 Tax=Pseudodesulfovibrio portus TaxID=231439 RepID=A0ABM8ARS5_9BACT|nr:HEAT repeat domain-containing protein [Pseudodesulfovibrio portus]BDQ34125.1 hypothetical protein JCM14722_16670 [Pseudodesulfovibrio portus]
MMDIRQIHSRNRFVPVLLALAVLLASGPCLARDAAHTADLLVSADRVDRAKGLAELEEQGQDIMPGLSRALQSGGLATRRGAAIGLSLMPVPGLSVEPLVLGLSDDDQVVRSLCAHGLGKIGKQAAPRTAQLLTHSDNRVRVGAALALSKMGADAVPALIAMLDLQDPDVTARAAWLLGILGRDALPAVPALIRALETDDMRVLHVVAETIDVIGPDPAMAYFELTMLGHDRTNCPATRIGGNAAFTLVKLLARPGTPLANIALYTLARMGPVAEPALRQILSTGNESQRTAAALLMTGIDPKLARTLPEDLRRTLSGALKNQ